MSYMINSTDVADGMWVVPEFWFDPLDELPKFVGTYQENVTVTALTMTREGRYRIPDLSRGHFKVAVSDFPFAVLRITSRGHDYVRAQIILARQVHNGELGRYPNINMPTTGTIRRMTLRDGLRTFVPWSAVAAAYGERDLHKLWLAFGPFLSHDDSVTYTDATNTALVYHPRRVDGPPLTHFTGESTFQASEEVIEAIISRRPEDRRNACRERFMRIREEHAAEAHAHAAAVRNLTLLPEHVLWDDPVLACDQLYVQVGLARSVLACKRFGVDPTNL